jgi:hypothetical protein
VCVCVCARARARAARRHVYIDSRPQEKERRRLLALEEHNAKLGGVDTIAERMAIVTIDQKAEEEAILADDLAPRSSYSGRYASFDPNELDAVSAVQSNAAAGFGCP